VFALDLSGLRSPEITVWTVRDDGALAGIGALKALGDGTGELKSMRTHPDHLRRGVADCSTTSSTRRVPAAIGA